MVRVTAMIPGVMVTETLAITTLSEISVLSCHALHGDSMANHGVRTTRITTRTRMAAITTTAVSGLASAELGREGLYMLVYGQKLTHVR
jgi:hypothetical protein